MFPYNDQQWEAIRTTEGPVLIIAGPGTGKTRTMVGRVRYILEQGLARPEEIMVTTFTRKAKAEVLTRLGREEGDPGEQAGSAGSLASLAGQVNVGNFHQIGQSIIEQNIGKTAYLPGFRRVGEVAIAYLVDRSWPALTGLSPEGEEVREDLAAAMALLFPRHNPRDPRTLAYRKKDYLRLMDRVREGFADLTVDCPETRAARLLLDRFRAMLRHYNIMDHSEVLYQTMELLEDPEVLAHVQTRAKYLMVDEYQDTNPVQEAILSRLARETGKLCVVGDDDQSLYRFRGATVENLLAFPRRYPGSRTLYLTTNYRSGRRIMATAGAFIDRPFGTDRDRAIRDNRFPKAITVPPERPEGGVYKWIEEDPDRWAQKLVHLVKEAHGKGLAYRDMAILSHSVNPGYNPSIRRILRAMEAEGIPCQSSKTESLAGVSLVRHLAACLLVTLLTEGGKSAGGRAADLMAQNPARTLVESLPRKGREEREEIFRAWDSFWKEGKKVRLGEVALSFLGLPPFEGALAKALDGRDEDRDPALALAAFMAYLDEMSGLVQRPEISQGTRGKATLLFLDHWIKLQQGHLDYIDPDQREVEDAVRVMTIHQSKGLEFSLVILEEGREKYTFRRPSQGEDLLPANPLLGHQPAPDLAQDLDTVRQYYTAMTRAKDLLVLTAGPDESQGPRGPRALWPPFLRLNMSLATLEMEEALAHITPSEDRGEGVQESYAYTSDLALYRTCPRSYFFFRVLGFPPRKSRAMAEGTFLHRALEAVNRKGGRVSDEDLDKILASVAGGLAAGGEGINPESLDQARDRILAYMSREKDRVLPRLLWAEKDLALSMGNYRLFGSLDLVLDDGILIDFKAHVPEKSDLLETYIHQLAVYRILLDAHWPGPAAKGKGQNFLYDLSAAREKESLRAFPLDEEDLEAWKGTMDRLVADIQAGDFGAMARDREACRTCSMAPFCYKMRTIGEWTPTCPE